MYHWQCVKDHADLPCWEIKATDNIVELLTKEIKCKYKLGLTTSVIVNLWLHLCTSYYLIKSKSKTSGQSRLLKVKRGHIRETFLILIIKSHSVPYWYIPCLRKIIFFYIFVCCHCNWVLTSLLHQQDIYNSILKLVLAIIIFKPLIMYKKISYLGFLLI